MLYLLAQAAAQSPVVNVSNNIPASNPWPTLIGTLLGALVGAGAGMGGHFIVHLLTVKRERRQRLVNAYATFSGAAYRFLSHAYQVKHDVIRISDFNLSEPTTAEENDYETVNAEALKESMTQAVRERNKAMDEMVAARSELILLLGNDDAAIQDVQNMSEEVIRDQDKHLRELKQTRESLDAWLQQTAKRLAT